MARKEEREGILRILIYGPSIVQRTLEPCSREHFPCLKPDSTAHVYNFASVTGSCNSIECLPFVTIPRLVCRNAAAFSLLPRPPPSEAPEAKASESHEAVRNSVTYFR